MIRNGIGLHESQKELTFKMVREIIYGYISDQVSGNNSKGLIINEGTVIKIHASDIVE